MRQLLVMLIVAGAVAAAARADNSEALANVRTIGVVSAIGDDLNHIYVGTTAFSNEESSESIADWQIDEFVVKSFGAQLAGRYQVQPVTYTKADFFPETSGIFVRADLDVEGRIKLVTPALDAYIVVRNSVNDDYVMRTNQHLRGIGFYQRGFLGKRTDAIFASCVVSLVDGRTAKEIDSIVLMVPGSDNIFLDKSPAHKRVDNIWGEKFAMTVEQRLQARDAFQSMLEEAIALSVQRLELLPKP
ncbi:MAG: hypothetical protein HOP13_18575 [Alphaproteobacteria bacterium]|nr:hypothetical protein [Alphaproteobacteria bacterium]